MELSRILIIDDSSNGYSDIEEHLQLDNAEIIREPSAFKGLELALREPPDILIIDVAFAGLNAWAIIDKIRRNKETADLPVVMVTGVTDIDLRIRSYEMGADAVVQKPYNRIELAAMVRNVAKLNRFRKLAEQRFEIQRALIATQQAYDRTIQGWVKALDLRDQETEGHSIRVAQMTVHLARAFEIPADDLPHIWRGALLHDIGKLAVPDSILKKRGPLTPDERLIIEKHPINAHKMLYEIEYLRPSLEIPCYHHEHWDGEGYPFKMAGEEIPFAARLFAVVDVWDAMSFNRPYRQALPQEQVRASLKQGKGRHFEPKAVDMFMELLEYFDAKVPSVSGQWVRESAA